MRTPKLRKNGDGRAFAVYPNSNGRRAYFGEFGSPEADQKYQAWLSEVMASLAAGEPTVSHKSSVTLAKLIVLYLEWSDKNHSEGEARNNRETLYKLLDPFCGEQIAAKFGPTKLRSFQTHLANSGRFRRTTVNNHVKRVRRFMRWCQSRELIPPGIVQELEQVEPVRKGRTKAKESEPVEPVPRSTWEATLPFLRKPVRAMVQIQFWCGMRPGEVCSLRPCDIDRSGDVWLYRPQQHKTSHKGKTLIKAIPAPAQPILEPWLHGPPEEPAFRTIRKRVFTALTYGSAVRRAIERAGEYGVKIPHWHPNQLRHAILTEIRESLGLEDAQWWAGHSESATTMIYTWTASGNLTRIATAIGQQAAQVPPSAPPQ